MITSEQWLGGVLQDEAKLIDWLKSQYHGEVTAAQRIRDNFNKFVLDNSTKKVVDKIAQEEELHAEWVGKLLTDRGVTPEVLEKEERYWQKVTRNMDSVEDLAAIGSLAEGMRLERIRAIVSHQDTPEDIREVFSKILPMEVNHEKQFAKLSTLEHLEKHKADHTAGREVLGLVH